MANSKLIRTNLYPYHVTARSNHKESFYLPMAKVWKIFSELLKELTDDFSIQVHAFVLMSNHFHALVTTPGSDLDEAMHHFLQEGARRINREAGRINQIFDGPYKWSVISTQRYYEHAAKYVYQNPIKAGIVERVEIYPYSSLHYLHRKRPLGFPISESVFERRSVLDLALWQKLDLLNSRYDDDQRDAVLRALRHSVFSFHRHRRTGRISSNLQLQLDLSRECRTIK